MARTIEQMWYDFAAKTISLDAPDEQRREMRAAFYAGCLYLSEARTEAILAKNDGEESHLERYHECLAYFQQRCADDDERKRQNEG